MKKIFLFALIIISFYQKIQAQGCVAVRQMGGVTAMAPGSSYNLDKGDLQMGFNYRYFHSWRHFVGTEEQPQRQKTGGGHDDPVCRERGSDHSSRHRSANRAQISSGIEAED